MHPQTWFWRHSTGFQEKKDEIPPEACRPLKKLKQNNVEQVVPEQVKQNNVEEVDPQQVYQ